MDFKLIGSPCGQHGPYTFYKAFKYTKNGKPNILAISEFFFVKLWNDSDLVSIGELQLLWEDKTSEQTLASVRLYILPENTPEGRNYIHGEDEVLSITEKVVIRLEDLLTWIYEATDWGWGLGAVWTKDCQEQSITGSNSSAGIDFSDVEEEKKRLGNLKFLNAGIDFSEVEEEKKQLDDDHWETSIGVVVLSYPRYCRYRGILKRLEGVHNKWLRTGLVMALGGIASPCKNTRVLFCKDTFDYPDLEGHELLCNHLAPKIRCRSKRKRKFLSFSPEESDTESETSSSSSSSESSSSSQQAVTKRNLLSSSRNIPNTGSVQEQNFLASLYNFMMNRRTPIAGLPMVGFKKLDLFRLYEKVRLMGGYDSVTTNRLWKYVAQEAGNSSFCKRHYEKYLLPFERHITGTKQQIQFDNKLKNTGESSSSIKTGRNHSLSIFFHQDNKDVRKRLMGTSLQNIRLIPVDKPRDKENIPLRKIRREERAPPEVIDLVEDSPVKKEDGGGSSSKKQKLDILREGGLEVTPVATKEEGGGPSTVVKPPPSTSSPGKISITVTPDVSHMLSGGASILPTSSSESKPKFNNFVPVPQSSSSSSSMSNGRSLPPPIKSAYNFSDRTVYGNPKDIFRSSQVKKDIVAPFLKNNKNISLIEVHSDMPVKKVVQMNPNLGSDLTVKYNSVSRSSGKSNFASITRNDGASSSARNNGSCEVLDLTVKNEWPGQTPIQFPKKGSNLEITLIPRPSGSSSDPKPRGIPVQTSLHKFVSGISSGTLPKQASSTVSSKSATNNRSQKPVQLMPAASTSSSRQAQKPTGVEPSVSAFIPGVMNPVLLQAFYNGFLPPQLLSHSLFPPNQSVQAFKEMVKNNRNKNSFPPFFQDGSTSITRIGDNSAPSSK